MVISKSRNRLVNFRISEDEFQALMDATTAAGARSMSDYARTCVLGNNGSQDGSLQQLEKSVSSLHMKFDLLLEILTEPTGAVPSTSTSTPEEVVSGLPH